MNEATEYCIGWATSKALKALVHRHAGDGWQAALLRGAIRRLEGGSYHREDMQACEQFARAHGDRDVADLLGRMLQKD